MAVDNVSFAINETKDKIDLLYYLNLDAGHYYGATGLHLNDIIIKYHDKMRSIHIKDKTGHLNIDRDELNQGSEGAAAEIPAVASEITL